WLPGEIEIHGAFARCGERSGIRRRADVEPDCAEGRSAFSRPLGAESGEESAVAERAESACTAGRRLYLQRDRRGNEDRRRDGKNAREEHLPEASCAEPAGGDRETSP